ncbi:MAG TPA: hypothetical protein VMO26_18740 [Vicinamibacterales bacterium]|nr:hypothetical protein [Vicinamibacterales bacterium]
MHLGSERRGSYLHSFIDLNNLALSRFSPEERQQLGVHTCPGGDRDSTHSAEVDYAELLPSSSPRSPASQDASDVEKRHRSLDVAGFYCRAVSAPIFALRRAMNAGPVLLVDHDAEWCEQVCRFLEPHGYQVIAVWTRAVVLESLADHRLPSAVLVEPTTTVETFCVMLNGRA